jgi:putative endonuclease
MFFVYALNSVTRNYTYVGMTNNVERRFKEHNSGQNKTTKAYRPFEIILVESYDTRLIARQREKFLKSGVGREFLKSKLKEKSTN